MKDVWIYTYPRSGNSLIFNILEAMTELYDFEGIEVPFHLCPKVDSTPKEGCVNFRKTHDQPKDGLVLYGVRDGRDAVVSYAHYNTSFNPETDWLEELVLGRFAPPWGSWSYHVLNSKYDTLVHYEDLVKDPTGFLFMSLHTLGLNPVFGEPKSFDQLHDKDPVHYRSGKVGGWKDWLNGKMLEDFIKTHAEGLVEYGYN